MRSVSLFLGIFAIFLSNVSWIYGDSAGQKEVSEICGGGCVEITKGPTLLESLFIFTTTEPWYIPMGSFYGYQVTADAAFKLINSDKNVINDAKFSISLTYLNLEGLVNNLLQLKTSLSTPYATGAVYGFYKGEREKRVLKILLKSLPSLTPPKFEADCVYSYNEPITNLSLVVNNKNKVNCSNIHPMTTTIIEASQAEGYFIIQFCTTDGHRYWLAGSNKVPLEPKIKNKIKTKILSLTFPNNGTKIYCEKDFVEQNYSTK